MKKGIKILIDPKCTRKCGNRIGHCAECLSGSAFLIFNGLEEDDKTQALIRGFEKNGNFRENCSIPFKFIRPASWRDMYGKV